MIVLCQDTRNKRAHQQVVEGSGKQVATETRLKRQLNQARKRAQELTNDDEKGDVYGPVITCCAIGSDAEKGRYQLTKNGSEKSETIEAKR